MKVELSITIVAYKNYDDIQNAIKTIEQYTNDSISKIIYIVDNTDELSEITEASLHKLQGLIDQYKDIKYISVGQNIGFGKGHNYVIDEIDSEYHAIVNPDIFIEEDAFSTIIEYLNANNEVGMCIPKITDAYGNRLHVYRKELTIVDMFIRMFCGNAFKKRQESHTLQERDYTKPFQVPFGQGSFLVIRTELFKELNGFDNGFFMYLEDADLCKRVNDCSKLMYFPNAIVIHNWEKGSHKNLKLLVEHLKSTFYYFKKWGIKLY